MKSNGAMGIASSRREDLAPPQGKVTMPVSCSVCFKCPKATMPQKFCADICKCLKTPRFANYL